MTHIHEEVTKHTYIYIYIVIIQMESRNIWTIELIIAMKAHTYYRMNFKSYKCCSICLTIAYFTYGNVQVKH